MTAREPLLGASIITLSICYQHLAARVNRELEPMALNMTQLSILTYFSRLPEGHAETITHLSQVMEMNQPMVTKAVKTLHNQGLITKSAAKEDARVSHLYLSNSGKKRLLEAQQACFPLIEDAFADVKTDELMVLVELLNKVKGRLG